jgi:NADH-quinone oxidoreductase subunit J
MGLPILFGLLAIVAIVSAIMMLISTNAVHSALWLVLNFATIGVLYLILNAPFIAMVQITVYAGAIMVLFLFVIMLLGDERLPGIQGSSYLWQRILAGICVLVLLGTFAVVVGQGGLVGGTAVVESTFDTSPQALGLLLFEEYVFPFEVTGILLLTAIIGVVILNQRSKKRGGNV